MQSWCPCFLQLFLTTASNPSENSAPWQEEKTDRWWINSRLVYFYNWKITFRHPGGLQIVSRSFLFLWKKNYDLDSWSCNLILAKLQRKVNASSYSKLSPSEPLRHISYVKIIAIIIIFSGLQLIYQEINILFHEHIKQMVTIVEIIP